MQSVSSFCLSGVLPLVFYLTSLVRYIPSPLTLHPSPFTPHLLLSYSSVHLVRLKQTGERFAMKKVNKQRMLMKKQVLHHAYPTCTPPTHTPPTLVPLPPMCPSPLCLFHLQVDQVFHERDILTYAENPFVVGFLCTFQTKVRANAIAGGGSCSILSVSAVVVRRQRLSCGVCTRA